MNRLEAKLKLLTPQYWKANGRRVGYQAADPLQKERKEVAEEAEQNRAGDGGASDDNEELRESRLFQDREGGRKRKLPWHMSDYQIYHHAHRETGSRALCHTCGGSESVAGNEMLLCDGNSCNLAFHLQCLSPQLHAVPTGDWLCPRCCLPDAERAAWDQAHPTLPNSSVRHGAVGSSQVSSSARVEFTHVVAVEAEDDDEEVMVHVDDDDEQGEHEIMDTVVVSATVTSDAEDAANELVDVGVTGVVGHAGDDVAGAQGDGLSAAAAAAAAVLEVQRRHVDDMQAEHEEIDREIAELQRRKRALEMRILSAQTALAVAQREDALCLDENDDELQSVDGDS